MNQVQSSKTLTPQMRGPFDPAHACRQMPTRHCPAIYQDVCGGRPCARFESRDESPWLPEIKVTNDPQANAYVDTTGTP